MQPTQNTPTGDPSVDTYGSTPRVGATNGWYSQCQTCGFEYSRLSVDSECGTCATGDLSGVRLTLLAMGRYLSGHGWMQGEYYASTATLTPAACLVGALSLIAYGYPAEAPADNFTHPGFDLFEAAMCHLGGYLTHTYGRDLGDVYTFNDTPGRAVGEVLAMLHEAASSDPGRWVPRCCDDTPCAPYQRQSLVLTGDPVSDRSSAQRVYVCAACRHVYYVEAVDPDDVTALWAQWRTWVDSQPHDDAAHAPGTSGDCGTCYRYCFCTDGLTCMFHQYEDGETSSAVWDMPGQPTYAQIVGGTE
jgi:hypothetical protein